MFNVLEVIFAPLLVLIILDEHPGGRSILDGTAILAAIFSHTFWRLQHNKDKIHLCDVFSLNLSVHCKLVLTNWIDSRYIGRTNLTLIFFCFESWSLSEYVETGG